MSNKLEQRHWFNALMRRALPLWIVAVLLLSLLPLKIKSFLGTTGVWHSWGHYGVFLITMLLVGWGVRRGTNRILLGLLVVVFGLALESSEVVLYRNLFEWHDLMVDALGVLTGILSLHILSPRPKIS